MVKLSIIILSYNSKTDLERLFLSLKESDGADFMAQTRPYPPFTRGENKFTAEVIVVDNGSTDGTGDWLRTKNDGRHFLSFEHIQNTNTGFAHGNNLGLQKAKGEYILFLNPDTKLEKNTLKTMLEFMESRPEVGISTCKVLLADGKLDLACRRRFPNPWNALMRFLHLDRFLNFFNPTPNPSPVQERGKRGYNMLGTNENQSMEIDSRMGAFMLVRKSAVILSQKFMKTLPVSPPAAGETSPPKGESHTVKAFDEDFFMYGEDLDLCWRCKEAGFKVWYYPKVFITHFKGSSSRKIPFRALKWFHGAMWIFYQKHYAQKYFFVFNWLVFLGIYLRLGILTAVNYFKKNPKVSG